MNEGQTRVRIHVDERRPLAAYPYVTVHPIRYGDLDPNNHVNNAVIATYMEIGRTEFFAREGLRLTTQGRGISLVHIEIEYHREILYPGLVEIAIGILKVGSASATFDQAVFVDGKRHVSASATTAQVDTVAKRATPWNDEQRTRLEALIIR
jgi:acyl-CoA thioester hydrolase